MAYIEYSDLEKIRQNHAGKKIIFCSGSFDLPHAGHAFFLEESKALGDILVATIGKDEEIRKRKGPERPIMNEAIRLKMIDSLKPVDYVFITNAPPRDGTWLDPIREIFTLLHPDVYTVNSDAGDIPGRQKIADEFGIKMVVLGMDFPSPKEKISTTWIIDKIKKIK